MKQGRIVCSTIQNYQSWLVNWKQWYLDSSYALIDNTIGADEEECKEWLREYSFTPVFYSQEKLRKVLGEIKNPSSNHYWNATGDKNIIWFYPHLRMLYFYMLFPEYDNYWFFDDDDQCDNWLKFITRNNMQIDFAATYVFRNKDVPVYKHIPEIDERMTSHRSNNCHWLTLFPGEGDILPETKYTFGSFYPFVFHSKTSLDLLLSYHRDGYIGYSEGYVPTILAREGLEMRSLYDKQSNPINGVEVKHKGIKPEWTWI